MRIDTCYELHKVASSDETRPQLCDIFTTPGIDGDPCEGTAVATNGRAMAMVPCHFDDGDYKEPAMVPKEAFKKSREWSVRGELTSDSTSVTVEMPSKKESRSYSRSENKFPSHWRDLLECIDPEKGTLCRVALDPHLLRDLSSAIGAQSGRAVVLEFVIDSDARVLDRIRVTVPSREDGSHAVGVLMPMRID